MSERKIQVVHLPGLKEMEGGILTRMIENYYDRLQTFIPGEMLLEIGFREAHKEGNRTKVEVRGNVIAPKNKLHAEFTDWVSEKALKQTLEALLKEAEKTKPLSKKN